MKPSWIAIALRTLLLVGSVAASHEPRFTAVSSFNNVIVFYENLRNGNPPSKDDAPSPEIKKRVCQEITNSQFFRRDEYEHVDPESEHWYNKLKKMRKNRDTLKELFKKDTFKTTDVILKPATIVTGSYSYENAYVPKEIRFQQVNLLMDEPAEDRPPTFGRRDELDVAALGKQPDFHIEHVFLCLTRQGNSTNEFQKWYVSKEYNTRAKSKRPLPAIAGRFVFKESASKDKFELVALAAEAALEFHPPSFLQIYYTDWVRKDRVEASKPTMDPLCRLISDGDEHSRLCSAIMNSEYFLSFTDRTEGSQDVQHECSKFEVVSLAGLFGNKRFFEWVAPCKVRLKNTKNESYYYISRAYVHDTVLVYHPNYQTEGKMGIVKMFVNVNIEDNGQNELPRTASNVAQKEDSKGEMVRYHSKSAHENERRQIPVSKI